MALDVARIIMVVKNGQTDSTSEQVHTLFSDVWGWSASFQSIPLNLFAPASLNGGSFTTQFAWEDPSGSPVWVNGQGIVAGTLLNLTIAFAAIAFRIHATVVPTADTTFKICKQYWADGVC